MLPRSTATQLQQKGSRFAACHAARAKASELILPLMPSGTLIALVGGRTRLIFKLEFASAQS
jgi:hypothetical protein